VLLQGVYQRYQPGRSVEQVQPQHGTAVRGEHLCVTQGLGLLQLT
jgi:hypothetical protein